MDLKEAKKIKKHVTGLDGSIKRSVAERPQVAAALETVATAELPPPGDARKELLKARKDQLEAMVQKFSDEIIAGSLDGKTLAEKFGVQNEIVQHLDPRTSKFIVPNARPGFVYQLVTWDLPRDNKGALVEMLKGRGWQLVSGSECSRDCKEGKWATCGHSMPEARAFINETGMRKVGDTVLMRIPIEVWLVQMAKERARRKLRQRGMGLKSLRKNPSAMFALQRLGKGDAAKAGMPEHLTEPSEGGMRSLLGRV